MASVPRPHPIWTYYEESETAASCGWKRHDLDSATAQMQELIAAVPGEYFVFDQRSQQIAAKTAADAAKR